MAWLNGMEYVAVPVQRSVDVHLGGKSMSEINSRTFKFLPRNWTGHVPESLSRALDRRHMLDLQQRAFHRDSHAPPSPSTQRPRRPA